jgi:hypothetical protein
MITRKYIFPVAILLAVGMLLLFFGKNRLSIGAITSHHDRISTTSTGNSLIVSHESSFNGAHNKKVALTGIKKRVPLNDAIHTISIPSPIAHVTISETESYIECDEAIFSSGLAIGVKNGKLEATLPEKSAIEFENMNGKPLCTIAIRMIDDALAVEDTSMVTVHVPTLKSITVLGASQIFIPHVHTKQFKATLCGASTTTIGEGAVEDQTITVAGTSTYNAYNLTSNTATVNVSGVSSAEIVVDTLLSGTVTGVSHVTYRGNAKSQVTVLGLSSCKKG